MLCPPVCDSCFLLGTYHKNKEHPEKQGDWLCVSCNQECHANLFNYSTDDQTRIHINTKVVRENKGLSVS